MILTNMNAKANTAAFRREVSPIRPPTFLLKTRSKAISSMILILEPILLGGLGYMTSMGADKSVIVPLLFLGGLFFIYLPIMISIGVRLLQIKIRSI